MFHVYTMASGRNGTLYIGMADHLNRRVWERQTEVRRGFTQRYGVHMLVWSERHESRETAFARERAMKAWSRVWKLDLIEASDPNRRDLALDLGF